MSDGGKLTWEETTMVSDMIDVLLADGANLSGVLDTTSGGALSNDDIAEYRRHLESARIKLRAMSAENGNLALSRGQKGDQAIRFASYMREAMREGNVNHAIAFAECLAAVAVDIAATLRRTQSPASPPAAGAPSKGTELSAMPARKYTTETPASGGPAPLNHDGNAIDQYAAIVWKGGHAENIRKYWFDEPVDALSAAVLYLKAGYQARLSDGAVRYFASLPDAQSVPDDRPAVGPPVPPTRFTGTALCRRTRRSWTRSLRRSAARRRGTLRRCCCSSMSPAAWSR
jgi:hypothetical protein